MADVIETTENPAGQVPVTPTVQVADPVLEETRREAAANRVKAKELKALADAEAARARKLEEDLARLESQRQKEVEEAKALLGNLQQAIIDRELDALSGEFVDPVGLRARIEMSKVKVENGVVVGLREQIDAIKTATPSLLRIQVPVVPASGVATHTGTQETEAQARLKRVLALTGMAKKPQTNPLFGG